MALPTEALFALATSALLTGPVVVLWTAYVRVRSVRVLLVAIGLSIFLASDLVILVAQSILPDLSDATETVELVADTLTAGFIALGFLLPLPRTVPSDL